MVGHRAVGGPSRATLASRCSGVARSHERQHRVNFANGNLSIAPLPRCPAGRVRHGARSATGERRAAGELFLEDLTSPELAAAIRAGKTTILVPIGGTEQNGPHMVLGKHNVRVEGAGRTRSRASSATRWSRRSSPTCRRAVSTRRPGTCVIRERSRCRPRRVPQGARVRGAQPQARRIPRHRVPRRSPATTRRTTRSWREQLNREWAAARCACTRSSSTTVRPRSAFAQALRQRGYSEPRSAPHAGLADTSLDAGGRSGARAAERSRPQAAGPTRRCRRSAPRYAPSSASSGVDAIVAQSVAAIRAAVAHR